jgi:ABC-type glycerol-3-phosphate transport system substrate-binding protein
MQERIIMVVFFKKNNMQKSSTFQTVLLIIFVVFIVVAVLIFSGVIPIGGGDSETAGPKGEVVIWGPYKTNTVFKFFEEINNASKGAFKALYVEKNPRSFDRDLSEAIASGVGPDLVILSQEQLYRSRSKLFPIDYASFPERTFRDTFIQEGELFLLADGIYGLPLSVDPIIMYYNRNMFEASGITSPPKTWEELAQITPKLTVKKENLVLTQSAVSFGSYGNLTHAKDILSLLIMQAGNPITIESQKGFTSALGNKYNQEIPPAVSAISFFTQFADPQKDTYTWNRSLPASQEAFISEQVAVYFGYASELPLIVNKNPNLNFDIAKVPQVTGSKSHITFGDLKAVGIIKTSHNFNSAYSFALSLTGGELAPKILGALRADAPVAPARRDLLSSAPQNLFGPTLYGGALISRGWVDPGDDLSDPIFRDLVDSVFRGAVGPSEAVSQAHNKLQVIIK